MRPIATVSENISFIARAYDENRFKCKKDKSIIPDVVKCILLLKALLSLNVAP